MAITNKGTDRKCMNVCDFVEIKWIMDNEESGTEIAQLVCIFRFDSTVESIRTEYYFVMICWKKKVLKNESDLPFSSYKYDTGSKTKSLYYDIVPIDSVIRPSCLIAHSQHSFLWGRLKKLHKEELKNQIYYCIPYELIVRDYCDDFVE